MIIGISGKMQSGKDEVGRAIKYLDDISYPAISAITKNNWQVRKFADKLKQICSILTGIPVEDFEKQEIKDRVLGEEWNWDNKYEPHLSVRKLLQIVGTDIFRKHLHPDVWVNTLFADYKQSVGYAPGYYSCICGKCKKKFTGDKRAVRCEECSIVYPNWIITDVRFPNEADAIKERGGINIRINRSIKIPNEVTEKLFGKNTSSEITTINLNEHSSEEALNKYEFDYIINNNGTIEELIEKVKEILIKEKILK